MRTIGEEIKAQGFDLKVTHRDSKTGLVVEKNPYILRVVKGPGGNSKLFERPVGSGNLFDAQNKPIGRWVVSKDAPQGEHDPKAEHVAFKRPETEDEKLAKSLITKDTKIKALEAELAAVKHEQAKRTTAPAKKEKES
jgi:hypothetical protein